jgi:signal transduction histidine kinase
MFRSIKWRLPVSYAAIALLAALALGVVLLTTVRSYYAQQELDYLSGNARAIGGVVAETLSVQVPIAELQAQLDNLAFLSQVRLRVLRPNGDELAASNSRGLFDVFAVRARPADELPRRSVIYVSNQSPFTDTAMISIEAGEAAPLPVTEGWVGGFASGDFVTQTLVVASTPFGFSLNATATDIQRRSDQVVREPLSDVTGQLLGYIELSQGPAYGSEIVDSVAQGWLIASSVAVGLAAVVGWLISRRITQPVLQLTTVTQRMAAGDLSRRADVQRRDELGTLAHSFNEMADQVEVTITTLRRFVSDAAHEIHSPLTALQTDLELSVTEQDETRRHELIDRAQQQTIRLRELADNLLDLSRVEAAGVHAPRVPVNLNDLLRDLSEPYASQAEQAGLTLSFDVPQDPIELRSDPAQLRRAIGNLIDNAIKFTPEGGAVTIELRKTAGTIELCVQDTGIGIPEDDLPQLFSRFHRGRNATTYPGNGLGLAIVKAIVEAHGGQVSAANTSPGARFCITLPEAR